MGTKGNAIDDTGPDSGGSVSWPPSALVGKLYSVSVEIKFRACINHESGWWPLRAARTPHQIIISSPRWPVGNLFVKAATTDVTIIWGDTKHNWVDDDHDGI